MRLWVALLIILMSSSAALADDSAELLKRIEKLEQQNAELYHSLEEKKEAGSKTIIGERLHLSGLIEVEASFESVDLEEGGKDEASDLVLATAQLGIGADISEFLSADLILLYEDEGDDSDIEVDEATLNFEFRNWFGRVGRQYLPFGQFYSHFISDPLTLELGETQETAVLAGYRWNAVELSLFAFNGDVQRNDEDDHLRDWGASVVATPAEGVQFGASYLSELADSDAELLEDDFERRVAGWSAFALLERGGVSLSGEVLGAVRSFSAADLDADEDGNGDKPLAWNVELGWVVLPAVEVAARVEGSDEFFDQPELQYGGCASWGVVENVSLSLEYLHGEFDEDFADGSDSRELVTAQLALEF